MQSKYGQRSRRTNIIVVSKNPANMVGSSVSCYQYMLTIMLNKMYKSLSLYRFLQIMIRPSQYTVIFFLFTKSVKQAIRYTIDGLMADDFNTLESKLFTLLSNYISQWLLGYIIIIMRNFVYYYYETLDPYLMPQQNPLLP